MTEPLLKHGKDTACELIKVFLRSSERPEAIINEKCKALRNTGRETPGQEAITNLQSTPSCGETLPRCPQPLCCVWAFSFLERKDVIIIQVLNVPGTPNPRRVQLSAL